MSYDSETNKKYLRERYASQRGAFVDFLGGCCSVCGSTESLEIDHINWREKSFSVGALWPRKKLPAVYEELKKCQLLCKAHHKEKTKRDLSEIMRATRPPFKHGTFYGFMKAKCACDECEARKFLFYQERNAKRRKGSGYGPRFKPSNPN